MKQVRIGCSGWMYDDWRGRLYPQREPKRRWLELYAGHFDTVEVNSTFYRLARRDTVENWVNQTPPAFLFAVKASRYLTHIRRLVNVGDGVARFYAPLQPLIDAGRLGPILWQLPENFHRDDGRLDGWLELIATAPQGSTRSSSATRAGSHRRSRESSATTASRSRSAITPSARSKPMRRRPGGASSASITAAAVATGTIRGPSWRGGLSASNAGAAPRPSTCTSTTIGAGSPRPTPRRSGTLRRADRGAIDRHAEALRQRRADRSRRRRLRAAAGRRPARW